MINICCRHCGHRLALDYSIDELQPGFEIKVWCVICGRRSVIKRGLVRTEEKQNLQIMKQYRDWR